MTKRDRVLFRLMEKLVMAKFDALNSKLDELKAAVDALPVVKEDDDVKAIESKVDGILADVKAKTPDSKPVEPAHDPDTAGLVEPTPAS